MANTTPGTALIGQETLNLSRGDAIPITLPPTSVRVLALNPHPAQKQTFLSLRPRRPRPPRELKIAGNKVAAVVHNLGGRDVDDVVVVLNDAQGKPIETKHPGRLAAPLDLQARTDAVELDAPQPNLKAVRSS